jgi:glutathione S-transferase
LKLISSSTSPYAQKVRVTAIEKAIHLDVENVVPIAEGSIQTIKNPLGKVPTLILEDGELIYDSVVICAYLDTLNDTQRLMPIEPTAALKTKKAEALGDGIMDAAFATVMELKRPDTEPSQFWLGRWKGAINRGMAEIDRQVNADTDLDIGTISYACALNYVCFRLPEIEWRSKYPNLETWWSATTKRDSFQQTALG